MKTLTSHERIARTFAHQEADRIPVFDLPWGGTVERWHREGMPRDVNYVDFFDLDRIETISLDNSPQYPVKVLEETERYKIYTTSWGVTLKRLKQADSTPEFLDFTIVDPSSWEKAKMQMVPTNDRIPWTHLRDHYDRWRQKGAWIESELWFGFDVTHSWTVGTENLLIALIEEPEWCSDMFNHFLDVNLKLLGTMIDAGYHVDSVRWPDDMGYKHSQFFSVDTYRKLLKPVHKRAVDWAHERGIKAHLHSCGDVNPFIPELIEIGIDALNPLEVKAGMDPLSLKKRYGDDLVLHGGINAVLWDDMDAMEAQIRETVPALKKNGGYIFSSDHSVPSSVSLDNFRKVVSLAKEIGTYNG